MSSVAGYAWVAVVVSDMVDLLGRAHASAGANPG
jgi:hypothetical protein